MSAFDNTTMETVYRIRGGILNGTEIQPFLSTILVKYPHRKGRDIYIPPFKDAKTDDQKVWHCCHPGCSTPNFAAGQYALHEHLLLHKGRLLKPWSKMTQRCSPLPAVRVPVNPWTKNAQRSPCATNDDRKFCVDLYIDSLKAALRRQGIEVME